MYIIVKPGAYLKTVNFNKFQAIRLINNYHFVQFNVMDKRFGNFNAYNIIYSETETNLNSEAICS